jgi:hypothetical protein
VRHLFVVVAAVVALSPVALRADIIAVGNFSFESPDASSAGYWHNTNPVPTLNDWGWAPATPAGVGNIWGAVIYNSGAILPVVSGVVGSQYGYCDSDNSGGTNPRDGTLAQELSATYEAGKSYTMTVGVAMAGNSSGSYGQTLDLELAWRSTTGYGILATTPITPSQISTSALTPFSVTVPVLGALDAAVGNHIELAFVNHAPTGGVGSWAFDNVQLISATPEPGAMVIIVTGVLSLLAYAWRKRKCVPS